MKRTMLVLATLVLVSTVAFGQSVQKGDFVASGNSEGWTLASGAGERIHIEFVTFKKGFDSPPTVTVSLTGYEATAGTDGTVRVHLAVEKITKAGCIIKVKTWDTSKIKAVWGNWLAISSK